MKPQFVIINEADAPCRDMICELVGDTYCYMNRDLHQFDGMQGREATSLEDFGFTIKVQKRSVVFTKERESVAKYADGGHRRWQDSNTSFVLGRVRK